MYSTSTYSYTIINGQQRTLAARSDPGPGMLAVKGHGCFLVLDWAICYLPDLTVTDPKGIPNRIRTLTITGRPCHPPDAGAFTLSERTQATASLYFPAELDNFLCCLYSRQGILSMCYLSALYSISYPAFHSEGPKDKQSGFDNATSLRSMAGQHAARVMYRR